jgi:serine phosphatase RsbU (regulator of sigma subunit)
MDLSLVIIDHKNKLLKFSGARNNAFISDGKTVTVLKATSKSIGGVSMVGKIEPERSFNSETIELKETITLVMATDGIIDQLNPIDEKFGNNNRFKELVLNLHHSSFQEGEMAISKTVKDWKSSMHQQDDMLLLAIKI